MHVTLKDQRDRASRYLLYGLFVLLPLTVVFGHRGVAPWLLLASLPAFARGDFWQSAFGALFDTPNLRDPFFAGFLAILFFCFWIFLSGLWSPLHHYGLSLYVAGPILVGGSVIWYAFNLPRQWTYRLARAFALAVTGGMVVLAFEGVTDGFLRSILPPNDPSPDGSRDIIALGRGVTALVPALFPAALIVSMIWNRAAALGLLGLGVVAAFSNDVVANAVAIGAGLSGAIIAFKAPTACLRVVSVGIITILILAPVGAALIPVETIFELVSTKIPGDLHPNFASWLHRLAVWKSIASQIPQGLPFGHGADYARFWRDTAGDVQVPGAAIPLMLMPTHPHNIFLQVWLELGLPGVAAFGLFIHYGAAALRHAPLPTPIVAAIIGAVLAILVSVLVEGSLWQVWRFAAMGIAGMGIALSYSLYRQWKA